MRELQVSEVASAVERLFVEANVDLYENMLERLRAAINE